MESRRRRALTYLSAMEYNKNNEKNSGTQRAAFEVAHHTRGNLQRRSDEGQGIIVNVNY
jgi:hypothetical protein